MTLTRAFVGAAVLGAGLLAGTSAGATHATEAAATACRPTVRILEAPRAKAVEVQAKAINNRGDVVGFADSNGGSGRVHAVIWQDGKTAIDLGVLPGYIGSEAYGINDRRVVFGLLYDKNERTVPFRWEKGRMTVLKG